MTNLFAKASVVLSLMSFNLQAASPVFAQTGKAETAVADIALSQKENRLQGLIEGAKKEGALNVYYSSGDVTLAIDAFTQKYGIKVNGWKANSEKVLQRVVNEARAGRLEVDLIQNNGPEMEALHREKLLQQVNSPHHGDMVPGALRPHKEWVGTKIDIYTQAYNTEKVKKEELPKTYKDLLDPKWKGRLGVEADDHAWFATLVQELGQEKGVKLFQEIVDSNGMSVRKGHSLLTNLTVSGEVPLSLSNYNYRVEQQKKKGAPIDGFVMSPAVGAFTGVGVLKKAPHPHAALLFYDFMLTEGQEILLKRFHVPTNNKIDTPLNKLPLKFIDPALSLDLNDKWIELYEKTVTKRMKY